MSGITHQSRLARLLALREQIDVEIAQEQDLEAARAQRVREQQHAAELKRRQLRRDSVPAHAVRAWARQYGHPVPDRGRVPDELIEQYIDANPNALRVRS